MEEVAGPAADIQYPVRRRRARERNVRYSICDVAMEFAEPAALVPSGTLSKCLDIATASHILILTCSTAGPSGAIVRMGQ
jgi:hypothetical protein